MKKRNLLILLSIILLIIISTMSYIFILENNINKINNITDSNSTDLKLNKSNDNMSLNNTDNNSSIDENLSNNNHNPSSDNNQDNDKKDSNDYYDEAMEAKLLIEKNVLDKNEIAGYPVYKHPRLDSWLVPIFDKNTKKFVSSVYVVVDYGGGPYYLGPQSYSEYKKVISGKTPSQSEINKRNKELGLKDIIEDSDSSDFHLLAKSNPDSVIIDEFSPDLDEIIILDSNPITPIDELDTEHNSTV